MADAQTTLLLQINSNLDGIRKAQQGFLDLQATAKANIAAMARSGAEAGDSFGKSFSEKLLAGVGLGAGFSVGATLAAKLIETFSAAKAAITGTIDEGVRLNATMETATVGIAGALKQFDPARFQNWNDALAGSSRIIDLIRAKSLAMGLSFTELAHTYQGSAGALFKGGITDLEQQVNLVAILKRSLDSLGIEGTRQTRDIADILNGTANRTAAGRMLGIDDADLKKASDAGELYQFLTTKLQGFQVAADASQQTLEVLEQKLANTKANVAAEVTNDLNNSYKNLVGTLTDFVQSDTYRKTFGFFVEMAKAGADAANFVAGFGTDKAATKQRQSNNATYNKTHDAVMGAASSEDLAKARTLLDSNTDDAVKQMNGAVGTPQFETIAQLVEAYKNLNVILTNGGDVIAANNAKEAKITAEKREQLKLEQERNKLDEEGAQKLPELQKENVRLKEREGNPQDRLKTLYGDLGNAYGAESSAAVTMAPGAGQDAAKLAAENEVLRITKEIDALKTKIAKDEDDASKKQTAANVRLLQVKAQTGTIDDKIAALQAEKAALDKTALTYASSALDIDQRIAKLKDDVVAKAMVAKSEAEQRSARAAEDQIRDNKYLTEKEKQQELYVLFKQQEADIDAKIAAAKKMAAAQPEGSATKAAANSDVKRLETERDVTLPKEVDLNAPLSASDELLRRMAQIRSGFIDIGDVAAAGIGGALNGISGSIVGLVKGTMSWRGAALNVADAIGGSLLKAGADEVAQYIVGEGMKTTAAIIGANSRAGVRTVEAAHDGATTVAQVGVHAAGETAKTGATGFGAVARGVIRVGETIFHGVQVAIRVAAHLLGETLKTAASLAGAVIRIGVVIAESIASVFQAGVGALAAMASIPYVGPFLAVASMAAIIAAGMGMVNSIGKGFADGGYTGAGGKNDPAGTVHKGEVVFSQADIVRHGGVNAVENLRVNGGRSQSVGNLAGSASSAGPTKGNGAGGAVNMAYFNTRQDAETWVRSQPGRRTLVDFMKQESYQL